MVRGSGFEKEVAERLRKNGGFAIMVPRNNDGSQFCDVIWFTSYQKVVFIDCKENKNNVFKLDRIECNQENCSNIAKSFGFNYYFFLQFNSGVYSGTMQDLIELGLKYSRKSITEEMAKENLNKVWGY